MSSADHYPAPPPMQSPYGLPLNGGDTSGLGGSAGPSGPGGPGGLGGPVGPDGPGGPGGNPGRRRRTLIVSALAVVAVVGIGGAAVALTGGDKSSPHPSTALAATEPTTGSTDGGAFPGGDSSASSSGKPNGDTLPGGPAVSSADIAGGPGAATGPTTGAPGSSPGGPGTPVGKTTAAPSKPGGPGNGAPTSGPAKPSTSAPGSPATSKPATTAPKPTTPASSAPKTTTPPPPSTDCTYLDLPPNQMPTIQKGSTNSNAVKQLQCLLKKSMLGIKPLAIDGAWGTDTQSALTNFQSCNNAPTVKSPGGTPPYPKLALDGVAGPQTWADLYFWDNQYFNNVAYYCNGTR
ncbi:MAG: hypothetical protein HOV87_28395 [Catenulispora sp.]|nr:hypothetical protein [Catenulispora sp.]